MRKVVMYCDRCGKEFEKWNDRVPELYGIGEFVFDESNPYLDRAKDLCLSCYTELDEWWTKPRKETEDKSESDDLTQENGNSEIEDIPELGW